MKVPRGSNYPFFAYGVFRRGELAFLSTIDLVECVLEPAFVRGTLFVRDGLPIIYPCDRSSVPGSLVYFKRGQETKGYERINRLEPDLQYRWAETSAEYGSGGGAETTAKCNYLVGRSPQKGSVPLEGNWNGRDDPLFTNALEVVREVLEANGEFHNNLKPLFRLQMAYLLLWSAIERYASLRYHLGNRVSDKIMQIGDDFDFKQLLKERVTRAHRVQRADQPKQHCELDRAAPRKSLNYYYQVRSNITHRGKAVFRDHAIIKNALEELLDIFVALKDRAFQRALRDQVGETLERGS